MYSNRYFRQILMKPAFYLHTLDKCSNIQVHENQPDGSGADQPDGSGADQPDGSVTDQPDGSGAVAFERDDANSRFSELRERA